MKLYDLGFLGMFILLALSGSYVSVDAQKQHAAEVIAPHKVQYNR